MSKAMLNQVEVIGYTTCLSQRDSFGDHASNKYQLVVALTTAQEDALDDLGADFGVYKDKTLNQKYTTLKVRTNFDDFVVRDKNNNDIVLNDWLPDDFAVAKDEQGGLVKELGPGSVINLSVLFMPNPNNPKRNLNCFNGIQVLKAVKPSYTLSASGGGDGGGSGPSFDAVEFNDDDFEADEY